MNARETSIQIDFLTGMETCLEQIKLMIANFVKPISLYLMAKATVDMFSFLCTLYRTRFCTASTM